MAVTKRAIDALCVTGRQYFVWDKRLKGFGVRVTPNGAKSYVYQYRLTTVNANARRMTLGKCSEMGPDQARELAMNMALLVRKSIDPLDAKSEQSAIALRKKQTDRALSFDNYCARYLELRVKPEGLASIHNIEAVFRLHSIPYIGRKPLPEITKSDVVALIDRIPPESAALRRSTYAILNKLFNWARSRDDIITNPMEGLTRPPSALSRDRVLDDDEIALALIAANNMDAPFGPLIRLLFATGQRRNECAALEWSELNQAEALWTLPAVRSKNKKANVVPLNRHAIAVLDSMSDMTAKGSVSWPSRGLVFTTTGTTPVSGYSRAKKRLDAQIEKLAKRKCVKLGEDPHGSYITPWRLHDIRRTVATGLQRLGVRFEVTESILNHTGIGRAGVAGVYQRHGWGEEKKIALDAWANLCDEVMDSAECPNMGT